MAVIASNVSWGKGPVNTFDFSYEKKRDGSTQYYKITVSCDPLTGYSHFGYPIYLEIKLAGTTVTTHTLKGWEPTQWSAALTYTTGWIAVPNKTEGTTALAIRIYSGSGSTRNTTYSYALPVDPAASKISATDANIESASTITITKYDSNFTVTISYKAAGQSGFTTLWTKEKTTVYGWTVPKSLYSLIPNAKEIEITLQCQTYSGNTLIGTETTTFTAFASESKCKPTVSVSSEDVNPESIALTGNKKIIVNGISNLKVVTTASGNNSATISSIQVYNGGRNLSGASVTFTAAGSKEVYVIVTDSRGFSTRVDVAGLVFVSYITPTIIQTITRDTPTGDTVTVSVHGKWFSGTFGAVSNTLRLAVKYKIDGEADYGSYTTMTVNKNGNEYTAIATLSGLPYTNAYRFQIRLDDEVYTDAKGYRDAKYVTNIYLSKGIPIFDWGEEDFRFNVPVYMLNGPLADYIIEETDTGVWYYRKWASGITEAWYHDTPSPGAFTTPVASGVYSNDTFSNVLVDMPDGAFVLAPTNASINAASNVIMLGQVASISATQLSYRLWTSYSTTPSRILVQIYVVGRWKQ